MKQKTIPGFNRRQFLVGSAAAGAAMLYPRAGWARNDALRFDSDPFGIGVASGDPWPDSIVLWTRLVPDPLINGAGGGLPAKAVSVKWEIAEDESMQRIVGKGTATAAPEWAHSVHVEVAGLQPARWYWYRFMVDAATSPVGRTRTAPAAGSRVDKMNFAFASCQHYEAGYYTAYRHMSAEDLDLVMHLGDYIYENGPGNSQIRKHNGPEIITVFDYRRRYALYKSDPLLQLAHRNFPWALVWDDHEVDNNYASLTPEVGAPAVDFAKRRAAAYKAYYEHMPLRRSVLRKGGGVEIYRRLNYGDLASIHLLDTRQYRTDQPCGDGQKAACPESLDPKATILGREQERWLMRSLGESHARWNVLAQQVMIGALDTAAGEEQKFPMDQWNGYAAERKRLLEALRDRRIANPVVLTGDIHSNWVNDLKPEFYREDSPVVATEFVGTSITSGGDGSDVRPTTAQVLSENPHIRFFNGQRGYVRCTLSQDRWQSDYRVVEKVTAPDSAVSTRASFVVENGRAGAGKA